MGPVVGSVDERVPRGLVPNCLLDIFLSRGPALSPRDETNRYVEPISPDWNVARNTKPPKVGLGYFFCRLDVTFYVSLDCFLYIPKGRSLVNMFFELII